MPRFQIPKENLSALPYWLMEPRPELAMGGPCLAIPGEVYTFLVQQLQRPAGAGRGRGGRGGRPNLNSAREIAVNLNGLRGKASAQWVNIWSGEKSDFPIAGPGVYQLNRPESFGEAPGLLIVRAQH